MLRYLSSGESHGRELTAIVEGLPAGLAVTAEYVNRELKRRQGGYGRGGRMKIESDRVEFTAGVRHGQTLGTPVGMVVSNRDWENWVDIMGPEAPAEKPADERVVTRPRPGHADLTGALKYGHTDIRNVLERSSARETASRVAAGTVARRLLEEFGIKIFSWVEVIGGVEWPGADNASPEALHGAAEASEVRCPDAGATEAMKKRIDEAKEAGDSLGGIYTVAATGVPPGLGSYSHWDRKLDGRIAGALMSIQAMKGVEVGVGFEAGHRPGSEVHDEIFYEAGSAGGVGDAGGERKYWPRSPRYMRKTNRAGGIEGGMSNGEPVLARAVMKPIPTLYKPLRSVDMATKEPFEASVERSDVCAVPAASVVAEAVFAWTLAEAFLEKFGGDSIEEMGDNYGRYLERIGRC